MSIVSTVVSTDEWLRRIQHISIFPKYSRKFAEAQKRTTCGAFLSVLMVGIVLGLTLSEIAFYHSVEVVTAVEVDEAVHGLLPIYFNMTFPNAHCDAFDIEVVDIGGRRKGMGDRVTKRMLSGEADPVVTEPPAPACGSCYGAEDAQTLCCRTCEDIISVYIRRGWRIGTLSGYEQCGSRVYRGGKGCNVQGELEINRISGQLHIVSGRGLDVGGHHIHDASNPIGSFDPEHEIHRFGFGVEVPQFVNPLDGRSSSHRGGGTPGLYRYFTIIVPTVLEDINGTRHDTFRYSITTHFKEKQNEDMPTGLFFIYDMSPVQVRVTQRGPYKSLLHLLLHLCAVAGGVFTVSALFDAIVFHGMRRIREKISLGKQT